MNLIFTIIGKKKNEAIMTFVQKDNENLKGFDLEKIIKTSWHIFLWQIQSWQMLFEFWQILNKPKVVLSSYDMTLKMTWVKATDKFDEQYELLFITKDTPDKLLLDYWVEQKFLDEIKDFLKDGLSVDNIPDTVEDLLK